MAGTVREAMSEVYVHQYGQETAKKAPYLRTANPPENATAKREFAYQIIKSLGFDLLGFACPCSIEFVALLSPLEDDNG